MKETSQQLVQDRIKDLRENTDFVSTLLESLVGYAIIAADFDGNVIAFNEGAHQIYGYAPEEIIGRENIYIFFPEEFIEAGKLQQIIDGLIGEERFSYEGEKVRKNGEIFPAQILFTLTKDRNGKVVGFIEIVADLTERKRAEKALRVSRASFHNVVDKSADGAIVVDQNGIVRFVNPAGKRLVTEPKAKQLLGVGKLFGQPIVAGDVMEVDIIRGNGEIGIAEMRVVDTEWEGETAYLASLRDITERKRAQEAKFSELESLTYSIAHDLRSPLISIQGLLSYLREDIQNQEIKMVQEDIGLLESGVRKMEQLVKGTLEYFRTGYLVKPNERIPFREIAEEVLKILAIQFGSIGATISLAKTFPMVYVDRMRIMQVLSNLIQNSIDYRDRIRPLTIEIGHWLSEDEDVLFVRDNGIGIDASETEKIFGLFYRGTTDGEGSGASLAIVKRILEAHGGRIWVQQSQPGKGTTMCFTLPQQSGINKVDNNGKD